MRRSDFDIYLPSFFRVSFLRVSFFLVTLVAAAFCVPVLLFADVAFGEIFFSATLIHLPRTFGPVGCSIPFLGPSSRS